MDKAHYNETDIYFRTMFQAPYENADMATLDREIAVQKKLNKVITETQKPVNTLYSWVAPERDYSPKKKRWYVIMGALALLFIVFAALTRNYLLVFVIIALVVVIYTLNTIPPHDITHQITNKGLYSFQTIFLWKNMLAFWIMQRDGKHFLHIEYKGKASDLSYKTMVILIGQGNLQKIVSLMVPHVDYLGPDEVSSSAITEWSQGKYVPLLDILGDNADVVTKDPKDAPFVLKNNQA